MLFAPLQIIDVEWGADPTGMPSAGAGLRMRPRDLAKFGSLYLPGGRWNGRQIIPEEWVRESTRRHIAVTDSIWEMGETGYGYQWWHDRFATDRGPIESYTAVGAGGQKIFVLPELRMVVTINAGLFGSPDPDLGERILIERILIERILPAVKAGTGVARTDATAATSPLIREAGEFALAGGTVYPAPDGPPLRDDPAALAVRCQPPPRSHSGRSGCPGPPENVPTDFSTRLFL